MQSKRKLAVLGSTGSIGTQALQVAALHSDRFQITALTANRSKEKLFEQVRQFRPQLAGLVEPISMEEIPDDLKFCQWVFGPECLTLAAQTDCDDVLVSVVGMAGLKGVLEAFLQNKRVLLANKEALVTGGHLVMEAARKAGEHSLLPVDSEHSAIFQCLQGAAGNPIDKIILTCSGGPFRTWDKAAIRSATKAQALKHPNWVMGQKITIDSATLFNKALEIMEAKWLFGVEDDRIQVVVHPQSVIHSGVQFADGALIAQLGTPDMRLPIQYAFSYPDRISSSFDRLDFSQCTNLTFEQPDTKRFRNLALAYEAMYRGGNMPCIVNAANEVVVASFLKDDISFLGMSDVIEKTMERVAFIANPTYDDYVATDAEARKIAASLI